MSDKVKRIIYFILFILVAVLIGLAIYFVFFKPSLLPTPPTVTVTPPGGLPTAPSGVPPTTVVTPPGVLPPSEQIVVPQIPTIAPTGPTITTTVSGGIVVPQKLVQSNAQFSSLSPNGSSINYYDSNTGLFQRVNPDGTTSLLSNQVFKGVDNVTWASNSDKAVVEFADNSKLIYNFTTNESFSLPSQFKDFSFAPDGKSLAAKDLKINPEDRWLVTVDDRGRNKQLIEHLGDNESRVRVQYNPGNSNIIATSTKSIDNQRAEVIYLTKDGTSINSAIVQGRDFQYKYSPDGNRIAYSVFNDASNYLPQLWISTSNPSAIDANRVNTGLNTWAEKCDFSLPTAIYCAVPKKINDYAGYLPQENDSPDNIYKIDPNTGEAVLAAQPLVATTIGTVTVSKDGKELYYTDKDTGAINKLDLQ